MKGPSLHKLHDAWKAKQPKYRNSKVPAVVYGKAVVFDSKAEYKRWKELELLQASGAISNLIFQPRFKLVVNGFLICTYEADSSYIEQCRGVVEDVKGKLTREYINKAKLFRALYPSLEHREVHTCKQKLAKIAKRKITDAKKQKASMKRSTK